MSHVTINTRRSNAIRLGETYRLGIITELVELLKNGLVFDASALTTSATVIKQSERFSCIAVKYYGTEDTYIMVVLRDAEDDPWRRSETAEQRKLGRLLDELLDYEQVTIWVNKTRVSTASFSGREATFRSYAGRINVRLVSINKYG